MGALKVTDRIYSVGVLDRDLRVFDIIMRTDYGTTYNSYLLMGDTKIALIESVKDGFFEEHIENILEIVDPAKIDFLILNHTEPDHSGSVARFLELAPNTTVLASKAALMFLAEIVNRPVYGRAVTESDEIDLGGLTLRFLTTPLLHWPDTQYTYVPEAKALFTCDSFGCHYVSDPPYADTADHAYMASYQDYFDHIIAPFKQPNMTNALAKIAPLDIELIAPGHGPMLRENIDQLVGLHKRWCAPEARPKRIALAYVSAYGYTRSLAEQIAGGIRERGVELDVFDLTACDLDAASAAIASADGFLLGSPTLLGDALPPIWSMLIGINPIIHKGKLAGAFGCYGWSGEAVPNLMARIAQLKLATPLEGLRVRFKPTEADLENAAQFGRAFADEVLK